MFEPIITATMDWTVDRSLSVITAQKMFIDGNRLIERFKSLPTETPIYFVIAETSFSTGLNFLLTWILWQQYAPPSATLCFFSNEKHPLTRDDLSRCLALWPELKTQAKSLLAIYPILTPGFHYLQFEATRTNLTLMLGDPLVNYRELIVCGENVLENKVRQFHVDAWFINDTPDDALLATIRMLSTPNTPSANTDFSHADNAYERIRRHTPWHISIPKKCKRKTAIVLGAGLAGCYTAHALARRGWTVTLLDADQHIGCGASGNHQAVLYPKLTAFCSPLSNFMLSAYLYAVRAYAQWPVGDLSGMLQLAYNQKEQATQDKLQTWLAHYPELAILVDIERASAIAGIPLKSGGMHVPHSGWVDSPLLCELLVKTPTIHWVANTNVTAIDYDGNEWHANNYHAEVLVVANGYRAIDFPETQHLPLKAVRGQMTSLVANDYSARLQIPLCADAHILPSQNGIHNLGATYHLGAIDSICNRTDDELNITKLSTLSDDFLGLKTIAGHWAGVRAATPDYLPLVGPVAQAEIFQQQFAALGSDSKRWIPAVGTYYDGLYVCAGFGSRGLTTIPLSSEYLAAIINHEPSFLSRSMMQSISPARFLRRGIIHG